MRIGILHRMLLRFDGAFAQGCAALGQVAYPKGHRPIPLPAFAIAHVEIG